MLTASWRPALVALNLALLAMIAYFAARITASSVAARLEHPTAAAGSRAAAAPAVAAVQPESAYAVIYERDAFNAVKGAPAGRSASDAKQTDLNVKLWGTAIAADPSQSYAIIEDRQRGVRI